MTNSEIVALAKRCEQAVGPDRELDGDIAAAVHLKQLTYQSPEWIKDPEFTASLDAAMTLVPEGWTAWELRSRRRMTLFTASISRMGDDEEDVAQATAASPALALCAAALRARASTPALALCAAALRSRSPLEDNSNG